jgi:hypothetical protein
MNDLEHVRESLSTLTPSQAVAVAALAGGATHLEAAHTAGVARETVTRWLAHHPGVRVAVTDTRVALMSEHLLALSRLRTRATEVATQTVNAIAQALETGTLSDPVAALKALTPLTTAPPPVESVDAFTLTDAEINRLSRSVVSALDFAIDDRAVTALDRLSTVTVTNP